MNCICKNCEKHFISKTNRGAMYCSNSCKVTAYRKRQRKICERCDSEYVPMRGSRQKYCSRKCASDARKIFLDIPSCIEGASRKLDKNIGYIRLYVPMHPEANTWGYVYEHRIVAENMIKRRLLPNEVVHHKNGKRWDNREENLEVMDKRVHSSLPRRKEKC